MDDLSICYKCIGESYLKEDIKQNGENFTCDFCGTSNTQTVPLPNIAEDVHSILQDHFYLTSLEPEGIERIAAKEGKWERSGEPVSDVILNLLDTSVSITEAIHEYLSKTYDAWGKDALCDPQPYDSEAYYAERPIDTYGFHEDWSFFKREILRRARFFNNFTEDILKSIFCDIGKIKTHSGELVIRNYTSDNTIYRARVADSESKLESILKNLPLSLGAPPHEFAKAGRMNAEGIGVFYGAKNIQTCINELRPPIGSAVVTGSFKPVRNLRLLDLGLLKDVYQQASIFDTKHLTAVSSQEFLKELVDELSAPIMPGAESREYLPTQLVAEFLAAQSNLELDGVIYFSSQTIERIESDKENKNIVLFPHATRLESYDIPEGTKINISSGFGPQDDYDDSIRIYEAHPKPKQNEEKNTSDTSAFGVEFDFDDLVPVNLDDTDFNFNASIELDMENIEIYTITGVDYAKDSRNVSRHKYVENGDDDF